MLRTSEIYGQIAQHIHRIVIYISVQGASLVIGYASTIQEVMKEDLTLTGFADDHSICKQLKSGTRHEQDTNVTLESSLKDIKAWMNAVRLKLNKSKTEFIYFGSGQQLSKYSENTNSSMKQ